MSQKFDLSDLMMHIEIAEENLSDPDCSREYVTRRLWAALYIAQDLKGWNRPANFEEVLNFPEDNLEA